MQIFSPTLCVVSLLLVFSFAMQKLLSLTRSYLFFLFLFSLFSVVNQKRSCCDLCQSVLPMFSFKGPIVSGLTVRALIHFESRWH